MLLQGDTMSGIAAYKENAVATGSNGRLVVLLYDGAIKFLRQAIKALDAGDAAEKGVYIGKATEIIIELDSVLDMEGGGEIAQNLRNLYNFMVMHLTRANRQKDAQMVREVIALLEDLSQAWKAVTE